MNKRNQSFLKKWLIPGLGQRKYKSSTNLMPKIKKILPKKGMSFWKDIGTNLKSLHKISKLWTEFQSMSRNLPRRLYSITAYMKAGNHKIAWYKKNCYVI